MLTALRNAALFVLCFVMCGDAFAQEPIRIDRPKEGDLVELEIEVAGVATPNATVEVWVDRVFIIDTVAEPDGWYVTRLKRPPNATEQSRIFVHELNADGQRTSSAVVRVTWSEEAVPEQPVIPPPPVAVDMPLGEEAGQPGPAGGPDVGVESTPPQLSPDRSGRVAVEYLVSTVGGITGAVVGLLLASAIGAPDSGERLAARVLLGSVGGAMAAAGSVYGVGAAMKGNGSWTWTAVGGLAGALLLVTVGLATDNRAGGWYVPVAIVAFGLPVLGYELTSDVSRDAPAPVVPQPSVGLTPDGKPTLGVWFQW